MPDATFEWLLHNQWALREYAFHWLAVGADGVVAADERLDDLLEQVPAQRWEHLRLAYAYAVDDSGTPALAGADGDQRYV